MSYEFYKSMNYKPFLKQVEKAFNKNGQLIRIKKNSYIVWYGERMFSISINDGEQKYSIAEHDFSVDAGIFITDKLFDNATDANEFIIDYVGEWE